jgi:hypothetical protein
MTGATMSISVSSAIFVETSAQVTVDLSGAEVDSAH